MQGSQYGSKDRQPVPWDLLGKASLREEFKIDTKILFQERNIAELDLNKIKRSCEKDGGKPQNLEGNFKIYIVNSRICKEF